MMHNLQKYCKWTLCVQQEPFLISTEKLEYETQDIKQVTVAHFSPDKNKIAMTSAFVKQAHILLKSRT